MRMLLHRRWMAEGNSSKGIVWSIFIQFDGMFFFASLNAKKKKKNYQIVTFAVEIIHTNVWYRKMNPIRCLIFSFSGDVPVNLNVA